ncbi:MAG: HupE/UreJ family protein [Robiginitomaculum sp.]|nr:HupE/UreJ family protein [Robiginitomaculum sp.]
MTRLIFVLVMFFISSVFASFANAHELRPAFLSITETSETEYTVLWKTPALGEKQLALKANFPDTCATSNGRRRIEENKFAIETWTLTCPQSLRGESVQIGGLEKTLTDVLVKTTWISGESFTARLTPDNTRLDFENRKIQGGVVKTYFLLGAQHILGGIDHLLFVLAVMLLIGGRKKLVFAITAFTIGHSVTLALATLDIVRLDPAWVEILIAMSIVLMAYEAVRRWRGQKQESPGLTLEFPFIVTFVFGLLHGFGFAGALRAIGLPQADIPAALLFFNIGVEAGQLLFIALVLTLLALPLFKALPKNKTAMIFGSYAIGIVAVFWTLQRAMPVLIT